MRYNDSVIIATQQQQLQTEEPPKVNECPAIDSNRRIRVAHTRRMLLLNAQHRDNDVQRTYRLQQRRTHHHATPSRPNKIKLNPTRKAGTQASVCVSSVINVKSESNSIQPAGQQHTHRYHGVNRIRCAVRHSDWHSKVIGAVSSVCTTTRSRRCRCRCQTYNHKMLSVSQ